MRSFDVHQHLWPTEVLSALERRRERPFARWRASTWELHPVSEPPFEILPEDHDPQRRVELVHELGVDRALVALSATVGIETLSPREAEPMLDAWESVFAVLPDELRPWATLVLGEPDSARLEAALDAGAVGLCVSAGAISDPDSLAWLSGHLGLLEQRLAPVFVHPGVPPSPTPSTPDWWGPCTSYVTQLHSAWHAFTAWIRPQHPDLRALFAALAGLAPLHAERTALRGGPSPAQPDPLSFYDTSTYGPHARRAMAAQVGHGQFVFGTDAPVVKAQRPGSTTERDLLARDNAQRLLDFAWVPA